MSTVLHFFTLPELAAELGIGTVVRVESSVQSRSAKTAGLGTRIAEVHARAIQPVPEGQPANGATILTYKLHIGSIQTIHGRAASEQKADHLDAELTRADRAVKSYLEGRGLVVRPGLIDIGGAETVRGTWDGLEVDPAGEGDPDGG